MHATNLALEDRVAERTEALAAEVEERTAAEHQARETMEQYRIILETTADGFWLVDDTGHLLDTNRAYCQMVGLARHQVVGRSISDFEARETPAETAVHLARIQQLGHGCFDTQHHTSDGRLIDLNVSVARIPEMNCLVVFLRDIAERKAIEAEQRLAATVFSCSNEGIVITDRNNRIMAVNPAFPKTTGYSAEEAIGGTPSLLKSGRHDTVFYHLMWQSLLNTGQWQGEIWNRRKNGQVYPEWLSISTVKDNHGEVSNYVAIFSDITERKASEEKIEYLAHHDPLTGLPNRSLVQQHLQYAIDLASRLNTSVAVLFLDLDHFKAINDSLGHHMGDLLLKIAAERLVKCVRKTDSVSRLGGDEFVVVLTGLQTPDTAATVAGNIVSVLAEPFDIQGHRLEVTASVGIALYPHDADELGTLMQRADTAMYQAKEAGRNDYRFYDSSMSAEAAERLTLRAELRTALDNNEFSLVFQPQFDLISGRLVGAEALIRWHSPTRGLVMPNVFIPVAEESGLILPIGDWVLHEACRCAWQWCQAGWRDIGVAVNLSALQLRRSSLEFSVASALTDSGLPPALLELELTESLLIKDAETLLTTMRRLKTLGVRFSIDDFGTGYSNLSYLKSFPLDKLKIDQSFVRDMGKDTEDAEIVRAIIQMARALNLRTLAEGIEDADTEGTLRDLLCDEGQGYFYAKPLPVADFLAFMNAWGKRDLPPVQG